jgi:hypothetical protein
MYGDFLYHKVFSHTEVLMHLVRTSNILPPWYITFVVMTYMVKG